MNRFSKQIIAITSMITGLSAAYATSVPNTSDPTTFLGPTARIGYTSTLNNTTAYSVAGEAGLKNFRVGGTIGFKIAENQLFKVSGEYLWQDITYAFFSGNSNQVVNQGALGAAYQYDLAGYSYQPQLGLSAYVSHAPSKTLSTVTGTYTNAQGMPIVFTDNRRIAGSNGAGITPSLAVAPWLGGRVELELNYDNVRYDTKNGPNEDASGLGGTVKVNQALTENVDLGLAAAVRQPFNNYAANLNWRHVQFNGDWTLGLFGDYTDGKNTLPNTWNLGLSANYFLDQRCPTMVPANLKGERNYKGEMIAQPISDNLLAWTGDPAVYMPQVLAIVDEKVVAALACTTPTLLIVIPNQTIAGGSPSVPAVETVATAPFFSGSNLTYSLSVPGVVFPDGGNNLTIDPATGVITATSHDTNSTIYTVTVTASNACGSTSSTFTFTFED